MTTTRKIFVLSLIVCFLISLGGFSEVLASAAPKPNPAVGVSSQRNYVVGETITFGYTTDIRLYNSDSSIVVLHNSKVHSTHKFSPSGQLSVKVTAPGTWECYIISQANRTPGPRAVVTATHERVATPKVVQPSVSADKYRIPKNGTSITFTFDAGTYKANRVRLIITDTRNNQVWYDHYFPYGPNQPKTKRVTLSGAGPSVGQKAWSSDEHVHIELYDGKNLLARSPIIVIKYD
jgi:hypothetical protein